MFWVFFLTGSLRAGLMSCVSSTVHPKVSLCVILCGKETQKKKKRRKGTANNNGDREAGGCKERVEIMQP